MPTENLIARERGELVLSAHSLLPADYRFLNSMQALKSISPPSPYTENRWRLAFGDQVGTLPLSGGRSLVIRPKMGIPGVVKLLAYALEVPPNVFPDAAQCGHDDLVEVWVRTMVHGVRGRLARGLFQDYLPVTERRWAARGRPEVKMNLAAPHRYDLYWSHTQPSHDLPENQLLLAALEEVCRLPLEDRTLRKEARAVYRRLRVQVRSSPDPLGAAERIQYHRLNEDYRPLHRLARHILQEQGPALVDGDQERTAFLLDMPRLFEAYATKAIARHVPGPFSVRPQLSVPIGALGSPLHPDIVICDQDGSALVILDIKYKSPRHRPDDLQQILAYARLLDCDDVGLIFPAPIGATTRTETALVGDSRIKYTSIELGLEESPETAVQAIVRGLALCEGPDPLTTHRAQSKPSSSTSAVPQRSKPHCFEGCAP